MHLETVSCKREVSTNPDAFSPLGTKRLAHLDANGTSCCNMAGIHDASWADHPQKEGLLGVTFSWGELDFYKKVILSMCLLQQYQVCVQCCTSWTVTVKTLDVQSPPKHVIIFGKM